MNPQLQESQNILEKAKSLGVRGSGVDALSQVVAPITSETLGSNETPIVLPETKISTTAAGVSGRTTALLEAQKEEQAQIDKLQAQQSENVAQQGDILEDIGLVKKQETESGQEEFGTDVLKDVRKEALGKMKTSQVQELAELKALENSGLTDVQRNARQSEIRNKYGMDQLQYQLEYSLANSDLVAAEQIISDRITLATEPLFSKLDLTEKVHSQISESLSKAEQREWETQMSSIKQEISAVENLEKYKGDIAITASQNGVPLNSYQQAKLNRAATIGEVNQVLADEGISLAKPVAGGGVGVLSGLPVSIQGKLITEAGKFDSSDIVKKYNATVDSLNIVNSIDPNSQNPADHQTIVYSFAKSLDPESVVREGEYATIAKYAQSMVSRYQKEITNAINGTGFLSAKAISDIKSTMNNNYTARKPQYDSLRVQTANKIDSIAGQPVADELLIDFSQGFTPPETETPEDLFDSVISETPESSNWAVNYFRELFN